MTARTDVVWLNGTLTPRSEARIDPLSHGLLFGAGIYDAVLLRDNTPVALPRHLARLATGAARLGLPAPEEETVRSAIEALSTALAIPDGRVRITLAAGPSPNIFPGPAEARITLITLAPLTSPKPSAALTVTDFRRNEHSPLTGIKFTACAENLLVQRAALAAGFDEAIFLNTAGMICEGAFSNIFIVTGAKILTPALSSGCLPGVTREVLLELCAAHGIPCEETLIPSSAFAGATEIFLTSSIRGLQPVHRLETTDMTAPGPVTTQLRDLYATWLETAHRKR